MAAARTGLGQQKNRRGKAAGSEMRGGVGISVGGGVVALVAAALLLACCCEAVPVGGEPSRRADALREQARFEEAEQESLPQRVVSSADVAALPGDPTDWGNLLPMKPVDDASKKAAVDGTVDMRSVLDPNKSVMKLKPVTYEELYGSDDDSLPVGARQRRDRGKAAPGIKALAAQTHQVVGVDLAPYDCKKGHMCPLNMTRPVCCKGGEYCCEETCMNDALPLRCGTTERQLRLARESLAENLREAKVDEAGTKANLETITRARILALQKKTEEHQKSEMTREEAEAKRAITHSEQAEKADIRAKHEAVRSDMSNMAQEESLKTPAKTLILATSVEPAKIEFRPPTYRHVGNICVISGRVMLTGTFKSRITQLPIGCRPRATLVFAVQGQDPRAPVRVDVGPDGGVDLVRADVSQGTPEVSLDGIFFAVAGTVETHLELLSGWHQRAESLENALDTVTGRRDSEYEKSGYTVDRGICLLTGVVQVRGVARMDTTPYVTELPPDCRPTHHTVFTAKSHPATFRVDVYGPSANGNPGGKVFWSGGTQTSQWMSLDGMVVTTGLAQWSPMSLANGFVPLGEPYTLPGYVIHRDVFVLLTGVVMTTEPGRGMIFTLPEVARPALRLAFTVQSPMPDGTSNSLRVDVFPNGEVWWIDTLSGSREPPDGAPNDPNFRPSGRKLSLDGIRFTVP